MVYNLIALFLGMIVGQIALYFIDDFWQTHKQKKEKRK